MRNPGVVDSVLDLIGDTPCLCSRGSRRARAAAFCVKLESANPGLSVKDRAADQIVADAERRGLIRPGDTVIERTSGNMGTGLALACLRRGYKLVVVMSKGNSAERRQMLAALGAKIVLVPQVTGRPGQVTGADLKKVEDVTEALTRKLKAFRADQFKNPSSVRAHERGTGPELWAQTGGRTDVFVSVVGSAGTFVGVSRFLKRRHPAVRCYVVEPKNAAVLAGRRKVPGRHKLQGLGYMEVPQLFDRSLADGYLTVTDAEAVRTARALARREGVLCGFTSGGNVAAALRLAREATRPLTIATVITDSGLKYPQHGPLPGSGAPRPVRPARLRTAREMDSMGTARQLSGSIVLEGRHFMPFLVTLLAATLAFAQPAQEPPPTIQSLFESGQYGPLVERVQAEESPSPQDLYLAGQSARKLDPPDDEQARNWLGRLGGEDTNAWTFVGRSAVATVNGDTGQAIADGRKAVELAPTSFYARYQLGLAYAEAKDYRNGATTLEKAATMKPSFAYAQYYAGMEYYQLKRIDKMAVFFERFLTLAPNAPERPAIQSLMRSIRGR